MSNYEKLKAALKIDEGYASKIYQCSAGANTIGYGRNLDVRGINKAEADTLLNTDIYDCLNQLQQIEWFTDLAEDDVRQNVLLNMCFNLGIARLMSFKRMWAAIGGEDYVKASIEMLDSRWAKQVGPRALRLSEEMKTGQEKR